MYIYIIYIKMIDCMYGATCHLPLATCHMPLATYDPSIHQHSPIQ